MKFSLNYPSQKHEVLNILHETNGQQQAILEPESVSNYLTITEQIHLPNIKKLMLCFLRSNEFGKERIIIEKSNDRAIPTCNVAEKEICKTFFPIVFFFGEREREWEKLFQ